MKFTTSLLFAVVPLTATVANVGAAPDLVTIYFPTSEIPGDGEATISGVEGGVDGNGHTTFVYSDEGVGIATAVAGASYFSIGEEVAPKSGPTLTQKFECSAIDDTNGNCIFNKATSSGTGITQVPFTSTVPNGKMVVDVTSTLPQAAGATGSDGAASATGGASGSQGNSSSATAGAWIGMSAVLSSAVLSGMAFLLF